MQSHLTFPDKIENAKYNLYGIVNHYGHLSGGHYTSYVKNEMDEKWYKYDDSSCSEIPESKIRSEHAYILFYKRKDVEI
jgi:ubiquitin C-terminal hydrolase